MSDANPTGGWRSMASAPRDGTRVLVTIRSVEQGLPTSTWPTGRRPIRTCPKAGVPPIRIPAASSPMPIPR